MTVAFDRAQYDAIVNAFTIDAEELREVAADFRQDMRLGLMGSPDSSLRMLPSYLGLPTGEERGDYLALDFGGTNVHVVLYRLLGNGKYDVLSQTAKPLKVDGIYEADPKSHPEARFFPHLSYSEALQRDIEVMDASAFSLCRENRIPILVLNVQRKGCLVSALVNGERIGTIVEDA